MIVIISAGLNIFTTVVSWVHLIVLRGSVRGASGLSEVNGYGELHLDNDDFHEDGQHTLGIEDDYFHKVTQSKVEHLLVTVWELDELVHDYGTQKLNIFLLRYGNAMNLFTITVVGGLFFVFSFAR